MSSQLSEADRQILKLNSLRKKIEKSKTKASRRKKFLREHIPSDPLSHLLEEHKNVEAKNVRSISIGAELKAAPTEQVESQKNQFLPGQYVVFSSKLQYFDSEVFCVLTPKKLNIVKEPNVASISLHKEVYCVKQINNNIEELRFSVCTLLNGQERVSHEFVCSSARECQVWVHLLNCIIFGIPLDQNIDSNNPYKFSLDETFDIQKLVGLRLPTRRILVLLNPFSGNQSAKKLFYDKIKPILDDCPTIVTKIEETTHAGHANEIARDLDLNSFDEIAVASGDGMFHEVINGLMSRLYPFLYLFCQSIFYMSSVGKDWARAIKTPLMSVPLGTSNALAASILGDRNLEMAGFVIAKGFTKPLDVMSIFQDGKRIYCFLTLLFGILANATLKTENLRALGMRGSRNTLGALREIAQKNFYRAKLQFVEYKVPEEEYSDNEVLEGLVPVKQLKRHENQRTNIYQRRILENYASERLASQKEKEGTLSTKDNTQGDVILKMHEVVEKLNESSVDKENEDLHKQEIELEEQSLFTHAKAEEDGGPYCELLHKYFPECFTNVKATTETATTTDQESADASNQQDWTEEELEEFRRKNQYEIFEDIDTHSSISGTTVDSQQQDTESGPKISLEKQVPFTEDMSDGNQIIEVEDDFLGICAVNTSHIALNTKLARYTYMNSEFIDLIFIRKSNQYTKRREYLKQFFKLKVLNKDDLVLKLQHQSMEVTRTQVFKLEPVSTGTFISIDGEFNEYVPTYCEVHPHLARIMVL